MTPSSQQKNPDTSSPGGRKPQSVVIVALDGKADTEGARILLARGFPGVSVQVSQSLTTVVDGSAADGLLLVVATTLEETLVRAGRAGQDIVEVMQAWTRETEMQLVMLRRHRRRLVMLDGISIRHDTPACAEIFSKRLGQPVAVSGLETVPLAEPDYQDAQYRLRSRVLVNQNAATRAMVDEMAAMIALPARTPGSDILLDKIVAQVGREQDAGAQAEDRLRKVQKELTKARQALQRQQQDMTKLEEVLLNGREDNAEQVRLLTDALQDAQTALEGELAQARLSALRLAAAEHSIRELETGRALREETLVAAFLKFGRDAEALEVDLARAYEERNEMKDVLDLARDDLERIYKSHSWKVTEPLRQLRRVAKGN